MKRLAHAALVASAFLIASTTVSLAMGAPDPHSSTPSKASGEKVSKEVGVALGAAQKAAQAGDMQTALAQIKIAQAVADRTDYDNFMINRFLSSVSANLKDYATASQAYDAIIASPDFAALADPDKKSIYHDAIVVSEIQKHWQSVVTYGLANEALKANDVGIYAAMAVAYYNLNDHANAAIYAQKSIDMSKAAGTPPEEAALEIVMNAQAKSDPAAALRTLESLAVNSNDPADWSQLVDHAFSIKGMKPIDALYLYRLSFSAGAMTRSDDYTYLASIANQLGYPTEAARALDQGMNSGKLSAGQAGPDLSKARKGAAEDERNLAIYAASAAKAKSGEQDLKMAEDYWGYGRYADAEASARQAIAKGGLKDPSEGQMILGMALVAQDKDDEAIQTLGQVTGNEGRMAAAHLWTLRAQAKKKQAPGSSAPAPQPAATH
ncbi:MAG TPA: hypothetical protein VN932_03230 [Rhizomicrobium sp.]|nr:hypothetical protein [Rhizomicrobium sp.]